MTDKFNDKDFDIIYLYLEGELTPEQVKAVEKRIKADKDFQNNVEMNKQIRKDLEELQKLKKNPTPEFLELQKYVNEALESFKKNSTGI